MFVSRPAKPAAKYWLTASAATTSETFSSQPKILRTWKMQTPQVLQIPTLTPLGLSNLCAKYLQTRFKIELDEHLSPQIGASRSLPDYPLMLPIPLASELDQIAFILADAFLNRGKHSSSLVDEAYRQVVLLRSS
jgi:hypothetical protein